VEEPDRPADPLRSPKFDYGARSSPDPFEAFAAYCGQRLRDDPHLWASTLFDELLELGYDRLYPTMVRQGFPQPPDRVLAAGEQSQAANRKTTRKRNLQRAHDRRPAGPCDLLRMGIPHRALSFRCLVLAGRGSGRCRRQLAA